MTKAASLRPTILDRYVVREVLPAAALGLLLFTFILLLDQISVLMRILISRGADLSTVLRAFLYILPSFLSVTIPMAFLLGVLLAFGRMASDSEIVALRASGVSPARLLRPVVALSTAAALATFYVVGIALPASNQNYREILFALLISKAKTGTKPRVFSDDMVPGMVLYVSDVPAETGQWRNVFIHDLRQPQRPQLILARSGRLLIEKERRRVELQLEEGVVHAFTPAQPGDYEQRRFASGRFPLPFDEFFPKVPLTKGDREMGLGELHRKVRELRGKKRPPREWGPFSVEIHKKFAIPAACFVFGLLGLGLSLGSKKEARSAAFGLSIAVIFVYYVIIRLGEQAGDTGLLSPWLAMWSANAALGAGALVLLWLNHREAAFDPLDPRHYAVLVPRFRRRAAPCPAPAPALNGASPRARNVVVVRVPRLQLPLPGLIDRYVTRSLLGKFAMVMVAFWALFVLMSFIDLVDDMRQNHVKGVVMLHYYAFSTPQTLHLLAPVGVLVAVLVAIGLMARSNEITALKAAGVSIYRAVIPALAVAAAVSALAFAAAELVLPPLNKVAAQSFNVIKGRPPQSSSVLQRRWILGSDDRFYNYDFLERSATSDRVTLYGLSVYDVEPRSFTLRDRLYAARAAWNGVSWDLERGWRATLLPAPRFHAFTQARTRELEPPSYFKQEDRPTETLGLRELADYIERIDALGLDTTALRVQLHRKVAYPVVSLVMALLAIPFSLVVARRGALYGVAASIVISIVYWASISIFEQLGNSAVLPAALAAWVPNLLFGSTGLYLMLTMDT